MQTIRKPVPDTCLKTEINKGGENRVEEQYKYIDVVQLKELRVAREAILFSLNFCLIVKLKSLVCNPDSSR